VKVKEIRRPLEEVEVMAKYDPLAMFLVATPGHANEITLSFQQIEQIIGELLPESSVKHRAWWGNETKPTTHVQARAWMDTGWRASKVDQAEKWVRFRRA